MDTKQLVYQATGAVLVGSVAYEGAALTTGKIPTMTSLCRRYRLLEVAIMAAMIAHLHLIKEIAVDEACSDIAAGAGTGDFLLYSQDPRPFARAARMASRAAARSRWAYRRAEPDTGLRQLSLHDPPSPVDLGVPGARQADHPGSAGSPAPAAAPQSAHVRAAWIRPLHGSRYRHPDT